mgnify:CR=1 FL=1
MGDAGINRGNNVGARQVIYILGQGGHAKTIEASLVRVGHECKQISREEEKMIAKGHSLIVGIGIGLNICVPLDRIAAFERYDREMFVNVLDETAYMQGSNWGQGVYVGAHCFIGSDAKLGDNVMVNHGSHVSHDCDIGDHTIISIGAKICGNVTLGKACAIGAGAIIVQNVELPDETRIPAGSLVVGPGDIRKPVHMVRSNGTVTTEDGQIVPYDGIGIGLNIETHLVDLDSLGPDTDT